MPKLRRWQAQIEIGMLVRQKVTYQTHRMTEETIDDLHRLIREILLSMTVDDEIVYLSNVGDHIVGRITYFRSDEATKVSYLQSLEKGWWYKEENVVSGQVQESSKAHFEKLKDFGEVITHFVTHALIPERGPDYHSRAVVGTNFRLPFLERVLREAEEHPLNDLLQRGWHIIALEYKGELSMTGELMNRKAIFVMGHPEAQAASFTLNSDYYKKS